MLGTSGWWVLIAPTPGCVALNFHQGLVWCAKKIRRRPWRDSDHQPVWSDCLPVECFVKFKNAGAKPSCYIVWRCLKMAFNLRNWVGWWFDVQSSAWKVSSTWSQDIPGLCTLDVRSESSFVIETASSYPSLDSFGTSKRPHNKHKHGQSGESLHLFQSGNSCNLPRSIVFVWKYKSKTHAHYFFLRAITSGASQQPQCGNTGNHSETQKK